MCVVDVKCKLVYILTELFLCASQVKGIVELWEWLIMVRVRVTVMFSFRVSFSFSTNSPQCGCLNSQKGILNVSLLPTWC